MSRWNPTTRRWEPNYRNRYGDETFLLYPLDHPLDPEDKSQEESIEDLLIEATEINKALPSNCTVYLFSDQQPYTKTTVKITLSLTDRDTGKVYSSLMHVPLAYIRHTGAELKTRVISAAASLFSKMLADRLLSKPMDTEEKLPEEYKDGW